MSGISREVREAKDSSEERRSKTRPRALSTRTDVKTLTTSKKKSHLQILQNFEHSQQTLSNYEHCTNRLDKIGDKNFDRLCVG